MFSKSLVQTGPNLSYILLAMDQYPTQNQFRADKAGLSPNGIIGSYRGDNTSYRCRSMTGIPLLQDAYSQWPLTIPWIKLHTLYGSSPIAAREYERVQPCMLMDFFLDWIHELSYFPYYRIAILGTCSPFEDVVMSLWSFYWLQWLPFDFQIFSWSFSTKKHSSSPFAWLKSWKPEGFLSFWEIRTLDDWKFITPGMFSYLFIFMLFVMFC